MPEFKFSYQTFTDSKELQPEFEQLLFVAKSNTNNAYAPYSEFNVSAAVLLDNGEIIKGVNIENASYPVGICAERSALSSAISSFPNQGIKAIAISYASIHTESNKPTFPCGMCRQFISECEDRNQKNIILILAGQTGDIIVISSAKDLLPFSFGGKDLKT